MSDSVPPHRRQPTRLPCPWDSTGTNTGAGCHFLLQCMKVKSESEVAQSCPTLATPWTAAHQAPLSSVSHFVVFLYFFALMTEESFLISPCDSLGLCIQMGISSLFSFDFHFSSFHSSDNHFAFFAFLFLGDGLDCCLLYNVRNFCP